MSPTRTTKKSASGKKRSRARKKSSVAPDISSDAKLLQPAGKTVLIVEDEVPLSHALEMKLKNDGYSVRTVTNGVDALSEARRGGYGIMLLDLIMPRMDGFTVLQHLREAKNPLPVIVLSNLGQDEDRTKAKELGAVDYFVKSNTPITNIIRRVHEFL